MSCLGTMYVSAINVNQSGTGVPEGFVTFAASVDGMREAGAKIGSPVEVIAVPEVPETASQRLMAIALLAMRAGIEVTQVDLGLDDQPDELCTNLKGLAGLGIGYDFRKVEIRRSVERGWASLTWRMPGNRIVVRAFASIAELDKAIADRWLPDDRPEEATGPELAASAK